MIDEKYAEALLIDNGIVVLGSVFKDIFIENKFLSFIEVVRDKKNHQQPSNKFLADLRGKFIKIGADIEFTLIDGQFRDIETSLRANMLHLYGEQMRNSFLTVDRGQAYIWIVPKRAISEDLLGEISAKISDLMESFNLKIGKISLTNEENLPSKLVFLSNLRQISPATPEEISNRLRGKKFSVPSDNWTTRKLDGLRKARLVIRLSTGQYVLTYNALNLLGSRKGARSPDMARMLALARQGG